MLAVIILALSLMGIALWMIQRQMSTPVAGARAPASTQRAAASSLASAARQPTGLDRQRLAAANSAAAARLWKLAFAAPSQSQASTEIHRRVRSNILAILDVDMLDPAFFPRRPALMPQLLQAVNDPSAASERISRIIAHDPVLTVDVLRLANSPLYRNSEGPIETIQRAIVVCGVDALRGMLATAMLRPVFRATRKNFPRFPRVLWERTTRAARAAELYALCTRAEDRFEAQMVVLLGALGPLVVYGAALDVYARNPHLSANPALCIELVTEYAPGMTQRLARDWQSAPRLQAALENSAEEPLAMALLMGEFVGTLAFLESQTAISTEERRTLIEEAGVPASLVDGMWPTLASAHT